MFFSFLKQARVFDYLMFSFVFFAPRFSSLRGFRLSIELRSLPSLQLAASPLINSSLQLCCPVFDYLMFSFVFFAPRFSLFANGSYDYCKQFSIINRPILCKNKVFGAIICFLFAYMQKKLYLCRPNYYAPTCA